jgi:hypothetical protein
MPGRLLIGTVLAVYYGRVKTIFLSFALLLLPALALAEPMRGTILKLDEQNSRLVVKTAEGEKALVITEKTLGLEHAIEGAEVMIEYNKRGNTLTASEINPSKPDNRG